MSTELERAAVQRLDLILAHAQKQTEHLSSINGHARSIAVILAIVFVFGLFASFISAIR